MKTIFIFLALLVSSFASAQRDDQVLYAQLMVVFSDFEKNFEFLKGELIEAEEKDSIFTSTLRLEGTKENNIVFSSGGYTYQAMINGETSEEGTQLVLAAWKEKLSRVLKDSFPQLETLYRSQSGTNTSGYSYSSEKITVLLLQHKAADDSFWINLVIKAT